MATYTFRAVVEPDDDAWRAYCPDLEDKGGATWGDTRDQALRRLNEVVHLVVADLLEAGEPLPKGVQVSEDTLVSVTV